MVALKDGPGNAVTTIKTAVMNVWDEPSYGPIGAPFDTAASGQDDPAISVGSNRVDSYGDPVAAVYDRKTLVLLAHRAVTNVAGYNNFAATEAGLAKAQGTQYLMVLLVPTGRGDADWPNDGYTQIDRLTNDPQNPIDKTDRIDSDGGPPPGAHGFHGEMTGWLQLDQNATTGKGNGYYVPVQTPTEAFRTDTTANDASVTVHGATTRCGSGAYDNGQPNIGPGQSGFLVVGYNPYTLAPIAPPEGISCFRLNYGKSGPNWVIYGLMATALQKLHDDKALVFVQSVNTPKASLPQWGTIAAQIQSLGGSADLFNRLNGSGNYALVGCADCTREQVAESSAVELPANGAGTVSGTLGPTANSQLRPSIASFGLAGKLDAPLEAGLTSAPVAWPAVDTPGKAAAYAEIWTRAKDKDDDSGAWEQLASADRSAWCRPVDELNAAYCDDNVHWGSFDDWVTSLTPAAGAGFTVQDFKDVKAQILADLGAREQVEKIIAALKDMIQTSGTDHYFDAEKIASTITDYTKPVGTADQIAGAILQIANISLSYLAYTETGADELNVAGGAGVAGATLSAIGQLLDDGQGDSTLDLTPTADALGAKLDDAISDSASALDREQAVILSDPAKLAAWGETTGDNGLDKTTLDAAVPGLKIGMSQYMWEQLLPRAWHLLKAQAPPTGDRLNSLKCLFSHPLADLNDGASYTPIIGFGAISIPITQWWTMDNGVPLYQPGELKFPADPRYQQFFAGPAGADPSDPLKPGLDKPTFYRDVDGTWQGVDDQTAKPAPYPIQCSY